MATSPIYFGAVKGNAQTIQNSDGTTIKDLAVAGSNGSKVFAPQLTSTDTSNQTVDLWVYNGSASILLGSIAVGAGAGKGGVASVNAFDNLPRLQIDNDGNKFVWLASGEKLQWSSEATVTTAKNLYAVCSQADF